MPALLVKGTIKPSCNVKHSDPEIRLVEYVNNLKRYILETNFDSIVFAENSGWSFDERQLVELAEKHHKRFEFLSTHNNNEKNMSVGDAGIMKEALLRSEVLAREDSVWKVSGRVFVRNADRILQKTNRNKNYLGKNIFLYSPTYHAIETWFFRANIKELQSIFLSDLSIMQMEDSCIEYIWMKMWSENKNRIPVMPFVEYPDTEGIRSSGKPYTISRTKFTLKNLLLKTGYYTVK